MTSCPPQTHQIALLHSRNIHQIALLHSRNILQPSLLGNKRCEKKITLWAQQCWVWRSPWPCPHSQWQASPRSSRSAAAGADLACPGKAHTQPDQNTVQAICLPRSFFLYWTFVKHSAHKYRRATLDIMHITFKMFRINCSMKNITYSPLTLYFALMLCLVITCLVIQRENTMYMIIVIIIIIIIMNYGYLACLSWGNRKWVQFFTYACS